MFTYQDPGIKNVSGGLKDPKMDRNMENRTGRTDSVLVLLFDGLKGKRVVLHDVTSNGCGTIGGGSSAGGNI